MKKYFQRFAGPYTIWIIATIVIPILLILYYSLIDKTTNTFSLVHFQQIFTAQYVRVFWRSFVVASVTTVCCLVLGFTIALFIARAKQRWQPFLLFLFILPAWTNIILRIYALLILFYRDGIVDNILGFFGLHLPLQYSSFVVYLGMIYNFLPFMILPLYTSIRKIDPSLLEASEDLGATRLDRLFKIIIPLSGSGIISGIIMVFLPAATTFVIPQILSAGKYNLIGNVIERQFTSVNNMNLGSALAILLLIGVICSIFTLDFLEHQKVKRKRGIEDEKE
jgi:spermidine/putrescine transport system permease protein